jgi:hypothetical protein
MENKNIDKMIKRIRGTPRPEGFNISVHQAI